MNVNTLVEKLKSIQADGFGNAPVVIYLNEEEASDFATTVEVLNENDELPYCTGDHVLSKPTLHVQIS